MFKNKKSSKKSGQSSTNHKKLYALNRIFINLLIDKKDHSTILNQSLL